MAFDGPGDEELVRRIAHADQEAVRLLYARHGRLVFSIALHVLGDGLAAEEVTQDVFLRVWEKAGTYDSAKAKTVTWLSRIARNRSIDVLRERGSRGARDRQTWDELARETAAEPDPADRMERSRQRRSVRLAIAALPESQRQALWLAFFQGLTHQQVAERLGEPLGTVKTRIRDAMRKLRSGLSEDVS